MTLDETLIVVIATSALTTVLTYLANKFADRRKTNIDNQKELRIAYARWYGLQKLANIQTEQICNLVKQVPNDLDEHKIIYEELKIFQPKLFELNQSIAEIVLLEKSERFTNTFKELGSKTDKFYELASGTLQTRKDNLHSIKDVETKLVDLESQLPQLTNEKTANEIEKIREKIKQMRIDRNELQKKFATGIKKNYETAASLVKDLNKLTDEFLEIIESKNKSPIRMQKFLAKLNSSPKKPKMLD